MRPATMVAHARLKAILDYEPNTGVFRWKTAVNGWASKGNAFPGKIAGRKTGDGYWTIPVDGKNYLSHRLAWFFVTSEWPVKIIDHADGNKLNNRWENLRLATTAQNTANAKLNKNNKSGFKGVSFANGKWQARISVNLGAFDTPEEASAAYMRAAKMLWGEFASKG